MGVEKMYHIYRLTQEAMTMASDTINIKGLEAACLDVDPVVRYVALKLRYSVIFSETDDTRDALISAAKAAFEVRSLLPAAEVDVSEIDEVYSMTNSINAHWTENEPISLHYTSDLLALSSTSVGDLISGGVGSWWIVEQIGFQKVHIDGVRSNPLDQILVGQGYTELYGIGLWAKEVNGHVVDTNNGHAVLLPSVDAHRDASVGVATVAHELEALLDIAATL